MRSLIFMLLLGAAAAQIEIIYDAVGDFSVKLLKSTSGCGRGNSVFSAYSISTALGLCLMGAEGETFESIKNALSLYSVNTTVIQDGFSDSVTELTPFAQAENKRTGYILSSANRLYVDQAFPLSAHYLQTIRNIFHAKAVSVDFAKNATGVQKEINSFVSNHTNKLIPRLLDQPLPGSTVMTLINALYFKGVWVKKLDERLSKERFNAYPGGSNQSAEWIGITKKLFYASSDSLQAQLVEIPYNSRAGTPVEASMIFILPKKSFSPRLGDWIASENFTWPNIVEAINSMSRESVDFTMPKFELETKFSLKKVLMDLGMQIPFTAKANFSEMIEIASENLYIDDVIHSAKIKVDEFGTEAAAATAVKVMYMSMPLPISPEITLTLNRSFLAMIVLRQGATVLPIFTSIVNTL